MNDNLSHGPHLIRHSENHRSHRAGGLRAAVLGANDGIVSTASLLIGIVSGGGDRSELILAGIAGLFAGAMSMAAGEYVSVHSQADTEKADLEIEKRELERNPEYERRELTSIYIDRGLEPELAREVARQLTEHDALAAHARDELGLTDLSTARPLQAALFSGASFSLGASLPLITAYITEGKFLIWVIAASSLIFLALLGAAAAKIGGASVIKGAGRVLFWGAIAMIITASVGKLFGAVV